MSRSVKLRLGVLSWCRRLATHCRRQCRETNGAAMIEFAIVAPVFLTILIGIFDVGIMMIIRTSIEEGARAAYYRGGCELFHKRWVHKPGRP
jgi:Flp pilus assembly pilin Flp